MVKPAFHNYIYYMLVFYNDQNILCLLTHNIVMKTFKYCLSSVKFAFEIAL